MRKFSIGLFIIGILIGTAIFVKAQPSKYLRAEFMDLVEAKKRWGEIPFDAASFRKGDESVRASMAVSLVKSKQYVGARLPKIREELGNWNGYFDADYIPAYFLQRRKKESDRESWQVVFLPDKSGQKIGEVKIHKNCCYELK